MRRKFILIAVVITAVFAMLVIVDYIERDSSARLFKAIRSLYKDQEKINNMIDRSWNIDKLTGYTFLGFIEFTPTTQMSEACRLNDFETVSALINKGASVNHVQGDITSPLICNLSGYRLDNFAVLKLLLENGANPNEEVEGNNPMISLCDGYILDDEKSIVSGVTVRQSESVLQALKLLVEYGGDIYTAQQGTTLMHILAYSHNNIGLEYVLENYTFGIEQKNDYGLTPLMFACVRETGGEEVVKLLLSKGADKSITDSIGRTAYDIATQNGNISLAQLLTTDE